MYFHFHSLIFLLSTTSALAQILTNPYKSLQILRRHRYSTIQIYQAKVIVALLLGGKPADYPSPELDWPAFEAKVVKLLEAAPKSVNPLRPQKGEVARIDMRVLKQRLTGGGGCGCSVM
jgi:hypothetical protein